MNRKIKDRVLKEAYYILNTKKTIRETAMYFEVSKTTVHKDLQKRLKTISTSLYEEINLIIKNHLMLRHIKGGQSTKEMYLKRRQNYEQSKVSLLDK